METHANYEITILCEAQLVGATLRRPEYDVLLGSMIAWLHIRIGVFGRLEDDVLPIAALQEQDVAFQC